VKRTTILKTATLSVCIALFASFALLPTVSAYGKANWQIGFAGTFVSPTFGNTGFWGWCAFVGESSGTDGDCQVSQYFHVPPQGFSLTCETDVQVTSWDMQPTSGQPPGFPPDDFFITGATITVNPSSPACIAAVGSLPSLPFDTGFPAAAGHYNYNALLHLFGQTGELQVTVTHVF
jgi:hypothetical protein